MGIEKDPEPVPEPAGEAPAPDAVDEWHVPIEKKKKKKAVSIGSWADLAEEPKEIVEAKEAAVNCCHFGG